VRVYGDEVSQVTFERLTVDGIYNGAGDDVTIQDNVVGTWGIVTGNNDNDDWFGYRPRILRNEIRGGSTEVKILLEVIGGALHPCPRLDAVVEDNVVLNTRDDPPPEATASVRVRCTTHTQFRRNRIVSLGTTIGLYLRDESDDGIYEDNVFVSNTEETIRIASGNEDKTLPARNVFRGNVFRSEAGAATYLQGIGADNRFEHNCFWSQAPGLLNMSAGSAFDHNSFYVAGADEAIITLSYRDDVTDSWTNNVLSYEGSDLYRFDGFAFHRYAGDYNLFHNRAGAVAFGAFGATLADWQAQSAAAGFASDLSSSEADPSFADAAAGDLCLQPGSPGTNAADDGGPLGATTCRCVALSDVDGGGAGGQNGLGGTGGAPVAADGSSEEGGCGCRLAQSPTPTSTTAGVAAWLALVSISVRRWPRNSARASVPSRGSRATDRFGAALLRHEHRRRHPRCHDGDHEPGHARLKPVGPAREPRARAPLHDPQPVSREH
jgi:hypothetical protein